VAGVPEIAVLIEVAVIAGVMPAVAEGVRVLRVALPMALKYGRPARDDLAGLTGRGRLIVLIDDIGLGEQVGPARKPGRSPNGAMVATLDSSAWS